MTTARRLTALALLLSLIALAPTAWSQTDKNAADKTTEKTTDKSANPSTDKNADTSADKADTTAAKSDDKNADKNADKSDEKTEEPPPPTADPVLKQIPDDALGFLLIKNLDKTDKAISKLGTAIDAPIPSLLSLLKGQAGIHEGFDENGSAAITFLPESESDEGRSTRVPFLLLPVSDYKKFIGQFQPKDAAAEITSVTFAGREMVVGHKGAFAVFALPDNKDRLETMIAATSSVDAVAEAFVPWMDRQQIAIVATPRGTKLLLKAAIAGLKNLQALMSALGNQPNAEQLKATINLYDKLLGQAGDQVEAIGFGLALDDQSNLSINSHTTFIPGSEWGAALRRVKPSKEGRFAGLRAAPFIFAAEGELPKGWGKGLAEFGFAYMAQLSPSASAKPDEATQKKYDDAMESMLEGVRSMSFTLSPTKPGESIYDGMVQLTRVEDTKAYLPQYEKSIEEFGKVLDELKEPMVKFSGVKKIDVDGAPGLELTMDMSAMFASMKGTRSEEVKSVLFGNGDGKLTAWMVAGGPHTIVTTFGTEEHAKKALADFKKAKSQFAKNAEVAATLKLLPEKAEWVGLVSVKGYAEMISNITSSMNVPFKMPELPAMPPIGFAAESGGFGLNTNLVFPVKTLAGVSKAVHQAIGQAGHPSN